MSLYWFTDATNQGKVAINSEYVVAVFVAKEGPAEGKTIISLVNGTVPVDESELDVVSTLNMSVES